MHTKHSPLDILVYNGPGTISTCVDWALSAFSSLSNSIGTANHYTIRSIEWLSTTEVLIFPGGSATPYNTELGEIGMNNIKRFVSSGKIYVGICAGAYFTASYSHFMARGCEPIIKNHLGLFDGSVHGPFFEDFDYRDKTVYNILPTCSDSVHRAVYHHGGGWFIEPIQSIDISVLARYQDPSPAKHNLAAIVKINNYGEGKGTILASFLHFEHPDFWGTWKDFISKELGALQRTPESTFSTDSPLVS